MVKTDLRVQYTRHALQKALLSILERKNIDRISVKELCEAASINRSTFYLHYGTPNDVLMEIEEEFMRTHFEKFTPYLENEYQLDQLNTVFTSILSNADLCRIIMGPNGNPKFIEKIKSFIRDVTVTQWQREFPKYRKAHLDYVFDFVFSGSMSLILNWISDQTSISSEELANRLDRLGHYCHLAIKEFH